jgi:hypothetical protein
MTRSRSRVILAAASAVFCGLAAVGCQHDNSSEDGTVHARTQNQEVRPDGTAVQTRTQVRETPGGTTVRETQTQERKVVSPGTDAGTNR